MFTTKVLLITFSKPLFQIPPPGPKMVLLKSVEGNRFLPMWIGNSEAAALLIKLKDD